MLSGWHCGTPHPKTLHQLKIGFVVFPVFLPNSLGKILARTGLEIAGTHSEVPWLGWAHLANLNSKCDSGVRGRGLAT